MNMLAIDRRPPPAQFRGSAGFLFAGVVSRNPIGWTIVPFVSSGAASSAYTYCLTQLVVVAHAVERVDVVPPDRFEAHADAGRVQVRLERDDLRVLLEHRVRVKLLLRLVRLDVDVDA